MADKDLILNVKTNIEDAAKDAEKFGDTIEDAAKKTDKLDDAAKKSRGGFQKLTGAVKGFGLALKAAGVGLIIAAFVALKEALGRNQKVMNLVNSVMTTISTTFNQVVGVIVDVVKWVSESSDRFDGLKAVISGLMTIALTPLKLTFYTLKLAVQGLMLAWEDSFLGGKDPEKIAQLQADLNKTKQDIVDVGTAAIEAGKQIYENAGDAINEIGAIYNKAADGVSKISIKTNFEQAKATTEAQNRAKLAAAALQGLIEKNDLLAETQRQIRDDETKTFAERIAANEELGEILKKQEEDMLKQADIRVAAAEKELAQNKDNIDLQVALKEAQNERAAVEAQVAGFRSEQMTNQVALEKELLEAKNEVLFSTLEGMDLELAELERTYEEKLLLAEKAGEDDATITEQYEKQKAAIKKQYAKEASDAALKITKAEQDAKKKLIETGFAVAGELAGENEAASKAIAVAETIYNTQQAIMNAMANVPAPFNIAQAIGAGIMGASAVKKILSTSPASSGGGGGGSAPASATPRTEIQSGAFTLEGGVEPEPARAYVVSDDITNSQNKLANIRRRATI
jgi:hypothetical protein